MYFLHDMHVAGNVVFDESEEADDEDNHFVPSDQSDNLEAELEHGFAKD